MAEKNERAIKIVAENRKARFNYAIEDTVEAGIALTGTEVKSIRNGKTTIAESYADTKGGEIWLINANIPEDFIFIASEATPSRDWDRKAGLLRRKRSAQ
jgi:SsrA-binding protein